MKFVENVILERDLFVLYKKLIESNVWDLARASSGSEVGMFPGFVVRDDYNKVYNFYWDGYFQCLYERINQKFYEKYNYYLPKDIMRIHLGAKNENSKPELHTDSEDSSFHTILGFLTPQWSKNWGGNIQVEDNNIDYKPGKFLIFKSNEIHNGEGPNQPVPYWRISINYMIKDNLNGTKS